MLKKIIHKLEYLTILAQNKLTNKQFIFVSSVLVGILAAFSVIVLKSFAHWVFVFATYFTNSTTLLQFGFIKVLLPVIGILLTVFVVKRVLGGWSPSSQDIPSAL